MVLEAVFAYWATIAVILRFFHVTKRGADGR
jgi:hypothetical protein